MPQYCPPKYGGSYTRNGRSAVAVDNYGQLVDAYEGKVGVTTATHPILMLSQQLVTEYWPD